MTEQSTNRCVVLLPADPHYTRLFDELFTLSITEAGLVPHCIQQSHTEPLPIDRLINELTSAAAVFADLSRNGDEIWLALGCAVALKKPLCLVTSRPEFSLPHNIQGLKIITYPAAPLPSDYRELKQSIANQLQPKRQSETIPQPLPNTTPFAASIQAAVPIPAAAPAPIAPPVPTVSASIAPPVAAVVTPVAQPVAAPAPIAPPTPVVAPPAPVSASIPVPAPAPAGTSLSEDLTAHEVLALSIIDRHASDEGISPRALGLEMQSSESAHLTSHAMNSLKRRRFIERRPTLTTDGVEAYMSDNLFITWSGKNWLLHHRQRTKAHRSNSSIRRIMTFSR
jgi:hypothetical protein